MKKSLGSVLSASYFLLETIPCQRDVSGGGVKNFKIGLDFSLYIHYILIVPQRKEVNTMGIHKGTKLTDNPKKHTLNFRYDDETEKKLNYLSEKESLTKSEIIRNGIDIQYRKKE